MAIDADALKRLVERELEPLTDARVIARVRSPLVEPKVVLRDWDYGEPGQQPSSTITTQTPALPIA
jgi:hypothetical protein